MTDVGVPSGGQRLPWAETPAPVRRAVQAYLGSPVLVAESQPGGFSPGLAARLLLADGRRVFVKAVGAERNPRTPGTGWPWCSWMWTGGRRPSPGGRRSWPWCWTP